MKFKRAMKAGCAFAIAAFTVFAGGAAPASMVYAAELTAYDRTSIESDLNGVDVSKYGKDEKGTHCLIPEFGFIEYAYSNSSFISSNYYGVYFYVYNPTEREVSDRPGANVVNMAVAYNADGEPSEYENCTLTLLDCTENHRFYKFKLTNGEGAYERARSYASAHDGVRRYDVAGVQLWFKGEQNATDSNVKIDGEDCKGITFECSGFAKGCGADADAPSTFVMTYSSLTTVTLDLGSTTYRFPYINEKGPGHQNQLDSVYFAIRKEFNDKYGDLYAVKCSWDEQRTTPIIVTNRDDVYAQAAQWIGQRTGIADKGMGIFYNLIETYTSSNLFADWGSGPNWTAPEEWMMAGGYAAEVMTVVVRDDTPIGYVFKTSESDISKATISSKAMKEWIYGHGSAGYLFAENVDEGRQKGYQERTFRADEPIDMLTFNGTASGWDKFCLDWQTFWTGKKWDYGPEKQEPIDPIHFVQDGDFTGTDVADAENLYIGRDDFADFKSFYDENKAEKNVFLLRFAMTDYFSDYATVAEVGDWWNPFSWQNGKRDKESTFIAQEEVFLHFDIIELTFLRDGKSTVIPVVASPIDVVGGITGPAVTLVGDFWTFVWIMCGVIGVLVVGIIVTSLVSKASKKE